VDRARAVALAGLLLAAGAASAHRHEPKRERLTVGREPALAIEYCAQGDLGRTLQRLFDKNRNRILEPEELGKLEAHLAHEATAFLRITVDGAPVPLTERLTGGGVFADEVCAQIDARAVSPIAAGNHRLVLADRHKDRGLAFTVELALAPGASWRTRPLPVETLGGGRELSLEFSLADPH
jgi:hypothetical protein